MSNVRFGVCVFSCESTELPGTAEMSDSAEESICAHVVKTSHVTVVEGVIVERDEIFVHVRQIFWCGLGFEIFSGLIGYSFVLSGWVWLGSGSSLIER